MLTNTALHPDSSLPPPPSLPEGVPLDVLEASDPARGEGFISSKGFEWSYLALAVGVLGLLFLLLKVMATNSDVTPTYERESQIAPREMRMRAVPAQPQTDLGAPAGENQ